MARQHFCDALMRYTLAVFADVLQRLSAAREARGLTLAQVARKIGKSKQHVWNWEHQRARPSYEDLSTWAESLGLRVVLDIVPSEAPPLPVEVQASLAGLDAGEQAAVLRYARCLHRVDGMTRRLLLRYVEDVDRELRAEELSASS